MYLFSLPFEIGLGEVVVFALGLVFGFALAFLLYLYNIVRYLRKKGHINKAKGSELSESEILLAIANAQNKFKDRIVQGETGNFGHMANISKELAMTIASHFYPKSKYPLYELSIDESIMLLVYISNRVDDVLDKRGLRMLRKRTIATLMRFSNTKKAIDESTVMQLSEKYKVKTFAKTTLTVLNLFNPFYWGRKLIVNKTYDLVIRKICLAVITIVGEETYKIYSKNVFKVETDIDAGIEDLVNEIKDDIEGIENDIENIMPDDQSRKKAKKVKQKLDTDTYHATDIANIDNDEKRGSKVLEKNAFQKFIDRKFKK